MFDRIAPRYDLLNHLLSGGTDRRWRRAAVDFLGLPAEALVLDLCTGTADLLIEAVERDPRRHGVGIDLSSRMLERAAVKLTRRGLSGRGLLLVGDIERLPLREGRFDAALIAFGIRNVAAVEQALREVRRVLRPGGRLVVLEFSNPGGLAGAAYQLYFEHLLPWVGGLVSGDRAAYRYLPASVARFPSPGEFGALMASAGFESIASRRLTLGIAHLHRGERGL